MRNQSRVYPSTRLGWSNWYARVYERTGRETAAVMAMWYYLLYLEFDNGKT